MSEAKRRRTTSIAGGDPAAIPTWGYHATQGARLFVLEPGAKLPIGWADHPYAGQHPHDATAAPPGPVPTLASEKVEPRPSGRRASGPAKAPPGRRSGRDGADDARIRGSTTSADRGRR